MGIDLCGNETNLMGEITRRDMETIHSMYKALCPPLIIASFISVVINAFLYVIGHLFTHNKTPVLLLSLNLASTDTLASLLTGLGLIFNSYLPIVHGVSLSRCLFLAFEIVRTSALIASALHLLGLAYIHYKGTVNPLHYRSISFCSQNVSQSIHCITFFCWLLPLATFTIYYFSIPCQAFLSDSCRIEFMVTREYRLFLLMVFSVPLIIMLMIYIRIFLVIKRNELVRKNLRERFPLEVATSRPSQQIIMNQGPEMITEAIPGEGQDDAAKRHGRQQQQRQQQTSLCVTTNPVSQVVEDNNIEFQQDKSNSLCQDHNNSKVINSMNNNSINSINNKTATTAADGDNKDPGGGGNLFHQTLRRFKWYQPGRRGSGPARRGSSFENSIMSTDVTNGSATMTTNLNCSPRHQPWLASTRAAAAGQDTDSTETMESGNVSLRDSPNMSMSGKRTSTSSPMKARISIPKSDQNQSQHQLIGHRASSTTICSSRVSVQGGSTRSTTAPRHQVSSRSNRVRSRSQSHSKALFTTLIILGTYLFCWMPAVVFLAMTCIDDGCPFPLVSISPLTRVLVSVITNSLVVVKAIVDPFIYTLRMKEVKAAIKRVRGNK